MSKLWISAGIELQDGADLKATKKALCQLVEDTIKEPGCITFEILQQQDKPECFTLWECWVNDDALTAHFEAPHTKAYLENNYTKVSYIERLQMNTAA
ncbi:putative quinol monooxygenase [Kiloniella sp. EL199]|uniref:putative quinol monooxygenase n=1 Tax=Kiloniella sp. EL199 TaxID=2107581 RepID=UPI000EA04577|nr:antibiotic biosynthesis monooxygenase [Kiloniella sp. EL199]